MRLSSPDSSIWKQIPPISESRKPLHQSEHAARMPVPSIQESKPRSPMLIAQGTSPFPSRRQLCSLCHALLSRGSCTTSTTSLCSSEIRRLHSSCRACAFAYGRRQASVYTLRPEHDVKRLPGCGGVSSVASARMTMVSRRSLATWSGRCASFPRTRCRQTTLRQWLFW